MRNWILILFFCSLKINAQVDITSPILYYEKVEQVPMWKDCEIVVNSNCNVQRIMDHVRSNLIYPKMALYQGIAGRVWLSFYVGKDGEINDIKVERGIGGGCDEEALRIIHLLPAFVPAQQNGEVVTCKIKLAVIFDLPEDYWKNRKKKYSKKALGLE